MKDEEKGNLVDDIIEKAKNIEQQMEEKFNKAMEKINKGKQKFYSIFIQILDFIQKISFVNLKKTQTRFQ